jgi:hypothetical protein
VPLNFFDDACKSESDEAFFGLCDDPKANTEPAYIDEDEREKWIAEVSNPARKNVSFHAIDNCIPLYREDGKMEKRCDGMLSYDKKLIFLELKDRGKGLWMKEARIQLTVTFNAFLLHHEKHSFSSLCAYIGKKQRPHYNTAGSEQIQRFKDETGLILRVQNKIQIC